MKRRGPGRPITVDKRRGIARRAAIGFQLPKPLKTRLLAAAKRNGRSLSAEVVSRLEHSFYREREAAE